MASAAVIAEHVVRPSGPAVRPFVDSYVGYHYAGFEPGVHVGMPSRRLTFVVSLADPLDVRMPGESCGTGYDAVVSGLHPAPAAVAHDGTQIGIELPLRLDAARALFGRPAAELAGVAVRLRDLWGHVADELLDRLASAADWSSRFAVLDDILPRVLARFDDPAGRPGAAAVQTWQLLTDTDGSRPIGAVADELGWSRRHLAQMFTAEYGVAPKTMSRIMRFDRSVRLVRAGGRPLTVVAATCGYADQAHMNREWRALAGSAPKAWLAAERLPIVQDLPDVGGPG